MKAYLIDSEHETVREVEFSGDYKHIYDFIGCGDSGFDCVRLNDAGDTAYVDDEGLLKDPKHFFIINGQILAGNALVLGTDRSNGESIEPRDTLEGLQGMVSFRHDLKVDGFHTEEGEKEHSFGKMWTISSTPIFTKREQE